MFLDEGGNFIQRDSLIGGRASGVPGTVRGLWAAHQRFGSLPWQRLLQPAIALADKGFEVHPDLAEEADARAIPLKVSAPFHCGLMAPAAQRLAEALEPVEIGSFTAPVIANVDAVPPEMTVATSSK